MHRFKFRAWDNEEKVMRPYAVPIFHYAYNGGTVNAADTETGGFNEFISDYVLEQSVNKPDIKQNPIFEGDIVKAWGGVGADGTLRREYYEPLIVFWNEFESAFMLEDRANKDSFPFSRFEAFEVLGNIHENKIRDFQRS